MYKPKKYVYVVIALDYGATVCGTYSQRKYAEAFKEKLLETQHMLPIIIERHEIQYSATQKQQTLVYD